MKLRRRNRQPKISRQAGGALAEAVQRRMRPTWMWQYIRKSAAQPRRLERKSARHAPDAHSVDGIPRRRLRHLRQRGRRCARPLRGVAVDAPQRRELKSSQRAVGVHAEVPWRTAMCQRMLTNPRLVLGAPGGRMWPWRGLKILQHVLGAHAEAKWSRSRPESLFRMGSQRTPPTRPSAGVADERALRTPRALQSLLPKPTRHLSLFDAAVVGILLRSLMHPLRGPPVAVPDESLLRRSLKHLQRVPLGAAPDESLLRRRTLRLPTLLLAGVHGDSMQLRKRKRTPRKQRLAISH